MPEWLLSFCVNIMIITGTIISLGILAVLLVVVCVEIYDTLFTNLDELDDEEEPF